MKRPHGWKAALIALLGSMALGLLALEGAVRALGLYQDPWNPPPKRLINPYGPNPYLVKGRPFLFHHIPRCAYVMKTADFETLYEINSRGFRGPEIAERPAAPLRRLLVIGDSMAEGGGVELAQAFPALIDEAIRPLGWETLNLGVQGGSPIYYAANLPRYLALHPDAALIVLFDNDPLDDYAREMIYQTLRRLPCPQRLVQGAKGPPRPLLQALALLAERLRRPSPLEAESGVEALYERRRAQNKTAKPGLPFAPQAGVPEAFWPEIWERTQDWLDLVERRFAEQGVELFIAHLSLEFRAANAAPIQRRHADLLEQSLDRWARGRGLPFFSLREALAESLASAGRPAVLFPVDPHLSAFGHRVVAQALAPWLTMGLGGKANTQTAHEP
jgi:lysophospholipase L1-like esterase